MYTGVFRINTKMVKEGSFRINAKLVKEELNPHDALKHHFESLRTDIIFLITRGFRMKMFMSWFNNTW